MNCRCCNGHATKFGRFANHNRLVQRYRCNQCGTTFSEEQPLNTLRLDFKQGCQVVHLICEGVGVRAISRLMNIHPKTVLNVIATAGEHCARLLDEKIRNVKASWVEVDEIHAFVFSKQQNTPEGETERGDFFTYLSVDNSSKLVINWFTGKRNGENTTTFIQDLKSRMDGRFQLTTDGYRGYWTGTGAIPAIFGNNIDYAMETKFFSAPRRNLPPRDFYSNSRILAGVKRYRRIGNPDMRLATISHAERMNLSVRLFNRRFTRKTLGYSKKLENLRHLNAIFFAHFNFCRVHSAHGRTPAQMANLAKNKWSIEDLLLTHEKLSL